MVFQIVNFYNIGYNVESKKPRTWEDKMDKKDIPNLGDEIRNIIQNAVSTMDFHQLNKDIGNTVNSALDEVRKATKDININFKQYERQQPNKNTNTNVKSQKVGDNAIKKEVRKPIKRLPIINAHVGKVSGILFSVFGNIFVGLSGIAIVVLGIIGNVTGSIMLFSKIITVLLPVLLVSFIMSIRGSYLRNRIKRLQRYASIINNRNYCTIEELSDRTRFRKRYVIKDIKKMITLGMIHYGRFDDKDTCIMLDDEAYKLYQATKENMKLKASEQAVISNKGEKENEVKEVREKEAGQNTNLNKEVDKAIKEGQNYMYQIRTADELIESELVSSKLRRMDSVIDKILNYIMSHPEQLSEIKKFLEYYLPTTIKLLNAYIQFEHQGNESTSIITAKREIEETLDTINTAFENLLDSLFEDIVMDVSSDISVLETILAQEGLKEKEFVVNKE